MELLDKSEEKVVLSYFYNEAELHAYAKSFDLEFVRCWPSERKLRLWEEYEKSQKKTHKDAIRTVCILKKHLD